MNSDAQIARMAGGRSSAIGRWASLGPYYAMFPVQFAYRQIARFTSPNDTVLDPFCGRGTAVFASGTTGRHGVGVELNPVGYVYGATKIRPPSRNRILNRLTEIGEIARYERVDSTLPEFFRWAFAPAVRRFLSVARRELNWRSSTVDRGLAALVLIYLHGKAYQSLSNQMRQTKSMAPNYSVAWWKQRKMRPPNIDPVEFLKDRIEWRYRYGTPELAESEIVFGDSQIILGRKKVDPWSLLLTSPPYCNVTNYWYDQWVRLWLLGALPKPIHHVRGRFGNQDVYRSVLESVFGHAAESARRNAVVYVRTDARQFTLETTIEVLRETWPRKKLTVRRRPVSKSQTELFGFTSPESGEVDLVLS